MTTMETTERAGPTGLGRTDTAGVRLAIICDVVAVGGFVAIGRSSHDEGGALAGWASTVWPFLVGAAVGWLVGRVWRHPISLVPAALAVWVSTLAVGMALRAVTGQGTAASFVIVASVFLAVTLFGWRALAVVMLRRRAARPTAVEPRPD